MSGVAVCASMTWKMSRAWYVKHVSSGTTFVAADCRALPKQEKLDMQSVLSVCFCVNWHIETYVDISSFAVM